MEESTAPTDSLLREGNRILRTLKSLDPGLGVQLNTPSRFAKDVTAYRKAVQAHESARILRTKTLSPAQAQLDRDAKNLISRAKNILKPEFGNVWNQRWTDAGFLESSIRTPTSIEGRLSLLGRMAIYLKDHPQHEVEKLGVTALRAEALFEELSALRKTLENQVTVEVDLSISRKTARTALVRRMRGLRHELEQVLAEDDARWEMFGFLSPAERREIISLSRARAKNQALAQAALDNGRPVPSTAAPSSNGTAVLHG